MNEQEDGTMMQDGSTWPCWPKLPVKRAVTGQGWPQMGVMVAGSGWRVYLVNMFSPITATTTVLEYDSVQAVLSDGWRVD